MEARAISKDKARNKDDENQMKKKKTKALSGTEKGSTLTKQKEPEKKDITVGLSNSTCPGQKSTDAGCNASERNRTGDG